MKGLILLPTLNRVELLKNFVKSYIETKATVEVKVLVDQADFYANKDAYEAAEKEFPSTIALSNTGDAVSMGDKVRHVWGYVKGYDWVGILNDDHYCITKHWDKEVEKYLDGTNMVSTNDGFWNFGFRVVGLTAWSMKLLDEVGFPIFPEGIHHYFIDDLWKALGESSGCWTETMKINIEHRHVFNGKMPQDETFKKVNDPSQNQAQLKVYEKFMSEEFPRLVEKIKTLRSSQAFNQKFS